MDQISGEFLKSCNRKKLSNIIYIYHFASRSMNTKYYFWDDGNGLHGHENVTLRLAWNVIPNAGNLPRIQSTGSHSFKFPKEYTTARVI